MALKRNERVVLISVVIVFIVLNIIGYLKREQWKRQYVMILEELTVQIPINSASIQEFESLPGIGPVLAQRIVDYRQQHGKFTALEKLKNVKGIGEHKFTKILPYVKL